MSLNITTESTPIIVSSVTLMLFGEPGIGKTSFGFGTSTPLLLDTDNGAHRSAFRKDSVICQKWEDIKDIKAADISKYDTLIIDTAGRMLDMITDYIGRNNSKLTQKSGALTMQGYGELKMVFVAWVKKIRLMGKDIVFIAHNKEEKDGDSIILRPDIQGGSYAEVFKVADAVAYTYRSGNKTMIDFRPTDRHVGKDTAKIGEIQVPDYVADPTFPATLITKIKDSINNASEAGKELAKLIGDYRDRISKLSTPEDFDKFLVEVKEVDNDVAKKQIKAILATRSKETNIFYDAPNSKFVSYSHSNQKSDDESDNLKKDYQYWQDRVDLIETRADYDNFVTVNRPEMVNSLNDKDLARLDLYIDQYADVVKK